MATQQLTQACSLKKHEASIENYKPEPSRPDPIENTRTEGLDCNICLDSVQDPVITFCGHLYCWPCIYKWIHYQTSDDQNQEKKQQPQCPVCKSQVSKQSLIPLYGRGEDKIEPNSRSDPQLGLVIPKRPTTPRCGVRGSATRRASEQPRQQVYIPNNSTTGMFGEMVYSTVFGSNTGIGSYSYPNSPRVRRQVKEAERSLSRLCFFLCCCVILCLLLF